MTNLFKHDRSTRPTLLDVFAPPENYRGEACLIVGFAADAAFLEEAMLQFTGQASTSRAYDAALLGLVFLDPRQDPAMTVPVPGLVRPALRSRAWGTRKGLLHAKLLWLVFRHATTDEVLVRIVVSTGNWTKSGAERLLDLVWLTECCPLQAVQAKTMLQEAADCQAAAAFLRRVADHFCVATVDPYRRLFEGALRHVDAVTGLKLPASRLIDSLDVPLGQRVKERLQRHRPDFVLAGSGFFEQPALTDDGTPEEPEVLAFLEGLTTGVRRHRHVLVVNPRCAGAVAGWHAASLPTARRWNVHAAATTLANDIRSLHAKFALFAQVAGKAPLQRGARYAHAVLYLGSGNLSRQGFLSSWRDRNGNIELGVLIDLAADLTTDGLRAALPIGGEIAAAAPLDVGDQEPELQAVPLPPAVVAVLGDMEGRWHPQWSEAPVETCLRLGECTYSVGPAMPFVHDPALTAVSSAAVRTGTTPTESWVGIPVIDATGGVCRQPFTTMQFDELLLGLSDWKNMIEDSEASQDLEEDETGPAQPPAPAPKGSASGGERDHFPISRAAMLIEQIAQVHDGLALHEVPAWLRRLEALLTEALDVSLLCAWRRLDIDFLTCLSESAFCPACLADPQTADALALHADYLNVLARVRARWQLVREG